MSTIRAVAPPSAKTGYRYQIIDNSRFDPLPDRRPARREPSADELAEKQRQQQAAALIQELSRIFQTTLERVPNLLHLCLTTQRPSEQMRADCAGLSLLFGLMATQRTNPAIIPFGGEGLKCIYAPFRLRNMTEPANQYREAINHAAPTIGTNVAVTMLDGILGFWKTGNRRTAAMEKIFKAKAKQLKSRVKKRQSTVPVVELYNFLFQVLNQPPAS